MRLDISPEEGYRELLARAEAQFRLLLCLSKIIGPVHVGTIETWLADLDALRVRELVEPIIDREHWRRAQQVELERLRQIQLPS